MAEFEPILSREKILNGHQRNSVGSGAFQQPRLNVNANILNALSKQNLPLHARVGESAKRVLHVCLHVEHLPVGKLREVVIVAVIPDHSARRNAKNGAMRQVRARRWPAVCKAKEIR